MLLTIPSQARQRRLSGGRRPREIEPGDLHGAGWLDWNGVDSVTLGDVTVSGERFRATVRPFADMPPLFLRRFGLAPPGTVAEGDDAASRERERRLRALGYVE